MKVEDGKIKGVKIITPESFHDFRGEYVETYNEKYYEAVLNIHFVEDDISVSRYGVMRGLHGDDKTWKLIQCLYGAFYFVVVDMREDSSTYLQSETFTINDKNRKQILVPAGCGNGHICLTDMCIFSYKQSEYYNGANKQFTVKWNDKRFNLHLPIPNPILSERDKF